MDIIDNIINLRIIDIPIIIAYGGVTIGISYIVSFFVVGVSCSIIEALTKKKVPDEKQEKIIRIFTACLSIIFIIYLLR